MELVETVETYKEAYRPQFHFSPPEKWMNDPNGLVYNDGIYHLFYQFYPDDIVWGPMHWGHAVSKDMLHWEHQPIALFPDEHGYIFSGSAVMDQHNTSGLGTKETPPLVAIFTYHDMKGEKAGRTDYQTQGIAFSLDNGDTWTKYDGNPVIGNNGMKDFRDPKVFWNDKANQWTMLLVAGDHLQLWNSDNLIAWEQQSEFGRNQGAHGGVWECPDLFPLKVTGTDEEKWVLLISINPGAPNGGSGTQYFIGDFDGHTFTSDQKEYRWLDWGTDNYAGVTYNHVPNNDRIFVGWMSNWDYARDTPTEKWRSAMTLPRKLSLRPVGNGYDLINYPLDNFDVLLEEQLKQDIMVQGGSTETIFFDHFNQTEVTFMSSSKNFALSFVNKLKEELVLSMKEETESVMLDRTVSGKTGFQEDFGSKIHQMPVANLPDGPFEVRILLDRSSIEVFINGGQYVMTDQIFPNENYTALELENTSTEPMELKNFKISKVKGVW
ncbi:MAG: glycoside hydrolase family 32 protein [Saonia sp.]